MIGKIFGVLGALLFVGAAVIGALYVFDAPVGGTVSSKAQCESQGIVGIETDFFGISANADVGVLKCAALQVGNYVKYHVRSEHTIIYSEKGGVCLFDSDPDGEC
jgi:hypothetical protein